MNFLDLFKKAGTLVAQALGFASTQGLTDQLVKKAIAYVKDAEVKFVTSEEKREWVVAKLVKLGAPESIARLAVELAVQALKGKMNG